MGSQGQIVVGLDRLIAAAENLTRAIDAALDELDDVRRRRRTAGRRGALARVALDVEFELVIVRLKSLAEMRKRVRERIQAIS